MKLPTVFLAATAFMAPALAISDSPPPSSHGDAVSNEEPTTSSTSTHISHASNDATCTPQILEYSTCILNCSGLPYKCESLCKKQLCSNNAKGRGAEDPWANNMCQFMKDKCGRVLRSNGLRLPPASQGAVASKKNHKKSRPKNAVSCTDLWSSFKDCNIDCPHDQACYDRCEKKFCAAHKHVPRDDLTNYECTYARDHCPGLSPNTANTAPDIPQQQGPGLAPQSVKECRAREMACLNKSECHKGLDSSMDCEAKCRCEQCQYETCLQDRKYSTCIWPEDYIQSDESKAFRVRGGEWPPRYFQCAAEWGFTAPPSHTLRPVQG